MFSSVAGPDRGASISECEPIPKNQHLSNHFGFEVNLATFLRVGCRVGWL